MKNFFVLSAALILLLCFVSCNASKTPVEDGHVLETGMNDCTESELNEVPELPSTGYADIHDLLAAMLRENGKGNYDINSTQAKPTIMVPILKSSQYTLYTIELHSNGYNYFYYYVPADYSEPYFDNTVGITVCWSDRDGTFDAAMEQLDLRPQRGMAYQESKNTWFINVNGKRLYVAFPESLPVTTEEELYSYFEFEEYTVSGNSGEVQ